MKRLKVYLAGPEVFLPDAVEIGMVKKRMCEEFGFIGLFPFDNEIDNSMVLMGRAIDSQIYDANIEMIKSADFGIFNLTPFRGVSADVGTVFELGAFVGLGKPVFAYTSVRDDLFERVKSSYLLGRDEDKGLWRDQCEMSVEDFGNADNLMVDKSLESQGHQLHRTDAAREEVFTDLKGFVEALREAQSVLGPKMANLEPRWASR